MKTPRKNKVVLLAVLCIALLGWLVAEFTSPPNRRARRLNTKHNIFTAPLTAPAKPSTQPAATPSTSGQG